MLNIIIDKTDSFFALGIKNLLDQQLIAKINLIETNYENTLQPLTLIIGKGHVSICLNKLRKNVSIHIPFFYKNRPPNLILDKIKCLLNSINEKKTLIRDIDDLYRALSINKYKQLSQREKELICALGSGQTISTIALQSQRAVKTVQTHYRHVCMKLGAINQAEVLSFSRFIYNQNEQVKYILII